VVCTLFGGEGHLLLVFEVGLYKDQFVVVRGLLVVFSVDRANPV